MADAGRLGATCRRGPRVVAARRRASHRGRCAGPGCRRDRHSRDLVVEHPVNSDYAARAIDLAPRYRVLLTTVNPWAPVIVLVGAAFVVVGAVFALRAARGAGMSSKYRSPAARREELERKVFADYERRQRAQARDGQPEEPNRSASDRQPGASGFSGTASTPGSTPPE